MATQGSGGYGGPPGPGGGDGPGRKRGHHGGRKKPSGDNSDSGSQASTPSGARRPAKTRRDEPPSQLAGRASNLEGSHEAAASTDRLLARPEHPGRYYDPARDETLKRPAHEGSYTPYTEQSRTEAMPRPNAPPSYFAGSGYQPSLSTATPTGSVVRPQVNVGEGPRSSTQVGAFNTQQIGTLSNLIDQREIPRTSHHPMQGRSSGPGISQYGMSYGDAVGSTQAQSTLTLSRRDREQEAALQPVQSQLSQQPPRAGQYRTIMPAPPARPQIHIDSMPLPTRDIIFPRTRARYGEIQNFRDVDQRPHYYRNSLAAQELHEPEVWEYWRAAGAGNFYYRRGRHEEWNLWPLPLPHELLEEFLERRRQNPGGNTPRATLLAQFAWRELYDADLKAPSEAELARLAAGRERRLKLKMKRDGSDVEPGGMHGPNFRGGGPPPPGAGSTGGGGNPMQAGSA